GKGPRWPGRGARPGAPWCSKPTGPDLFVEGEEAEQRPAAGRWGLGGGAREAGAEEADLHAVVGSGGEHGEEGRLVGVGRGEREDVAVVAALAEIGLRQGIAGELGDATERGAIEEATLGLIAGGGLERPHDAGRALAAELGRVELEAHLHARGEAGAKAGAE